MTTWFSHPNCWITFLVDVITKDKLCSIYQILIIYGIKTNEFVYVVWLLQAPYWLWLCLCQRDTMEPRRRDDRNWPGLHQMEQWPTAAVLSMRLLQGRCAWQHQEELEEGLCHQHYCAYPPSHLLCHWLRRFQKQ